MARAGRPRKQGPRTKSGRLKQQHDAGTDELRAKKVALVGPGGDPSKSTNTHALGIRPPVPETLLEKPKMNGRI